MSQFGKDKDKDKDDESAFIASGLTGSAYDTVQRYGAANKEFLVSYEGVDNSTGQTFQKSLKGISRYKINPQYREQNIKQQAGYAAEVKDVARSNAENIIKGSKTRVSRTDDLPKMEDKTFGQIGGVNEQFYDMAVLDSDGRVLDASQMKFVGSDTNDLLDHLMGRRYQKYVDRGVKFRVAPEDYDELKKLIPQKIEKLQRQMAAAQARGKNDVAQKHCQQIEKLKKIDITLDKSNVTRKEAIEARMNPEWSTAKDMITISHRAGVEAAKYGAAIGGGISAVRNFSDVISGKKNLSEAAIDVVWDASKGTAVSYITGFSGSALAGFMKNSTSELVCRVSKTNLPATIAVSVLETGKTLCRYFEGEIDGVECLEELGEKGVGMLGAGMSAAIGQMAIPVPVVGALIGSMVGYALSSGCYQGLVNTLKSAKFAHERRLQIEHECEEAIHAIREYRAEMETVIARYLSEHIVSFHSAFEEMDRAFAANDANGFIAGANTITRQLGGQAQFKTMDEFDALMLSAEPFKV